MTHVKPGRSIPIVVALLFVTTAFLPFLGNPAAADPPVVLPPPPVFYEDWETGTDGWTLAGGLTGHGWTTPCGGTTGCSLKGQPPCCATYSTATHPLNLTMSGKTYFSFLFRGDNINTDTDTSIRLGFAEGGFVEIHTSHGVRPSNAWLLRNQASATASGIQFGSWSANTWYLGVIIVDPDANTARGELRYQNGGLIAASSTNIAIPANAATLSFVEMNTVYWGNVHSSYQYDNLRIGLGTTSAPALTGILGKVGQIRLDWTAPADIGTAAPTSYKIYRGTEPGAETYLTTVGNVNTWTNTGLPHGATYFYRVAAVNSNGDSPLSNRLMATTMYYTEGFENGWNHWTQPGDGMSIDCAAGNPGCSLQVDPACCTEDVYVTSSRTLNTEILYPVYVRFWFTSASLYGDVDSFLTVDLNDGAAVTLHVSEGITPNNGVTLASEGNGQSTFASWSPAGDWFEGVLFIDPMRDVARAELLDANGTLVGTSGTLAIPAGAGILERVSVSGVFWGNLTTTFHYDTLSINYAHTEPRSLEAWADGTSIALSWLAPTTPIRDAPTSYKIYRGASSGNLSHVATVGNVLTYTDTGLDLGTTYHYAVSAVNAAGEGYLSAEARAKTAKFVENWENGWNGWTQGGRNESTIDCATGNPGCSLRFAPTPEDVRSFVSKDVNLSFDGLTTVSFSYRSTDTSADTDTDFTLKLWGGKTVRLHLSEGWRNPNNEVTLYVQDGSNSRHVTWAGSTWYTAAFVFDPAGDRVKAEFRTAAGVLLGSTGWLAIPANADGITGFELNAVQWTTAGPYADFFYDNLRVYSPPALEGPATTTVEPHHNQAIVRWTAATANEGKAITGYRVYRSVSGYNLVHVANLGATATSWTDNGVTDGQGVCYAIVAIAGATVRESTSGPKTCAVVNPVPPGMPGNVVAQKVLGGIKVTWTAAAPGDGAIVKYYLYRWGPGLQDQELCTDSGTVTSYTDSTVLPGQRYSYMVRAVSQYVNGPWSTTYGSATA